MKRLGSRRTVRVRHPGMSKRVETYLAGRGTVRAQNEPEDLNAGDILIEESFRGQHPHSRRNGALEVQSSRKQGDNQRRK